MQLHGYVRSWGPLGPPDVPRRDLNAVTLVAQAFLVQSWVPGVGDQLRLGGDSLNPRTLWSIWGKTMVKPVCPVDGALMPFTVEDVAFYLGANQDFLGASAGLFTSGPNIMRFMTDWFSTPDPMFSSKSTIVISLWSGMFFLAEIIYIVTNSDCLLGNFCVPGTNRAYHWLIMQTYSIRVFMYIHIHIIIFIIIYFLDIYLIMYIYI